MKRYSIIISNIYITFEYPTGISQLILDRRSSMLFRQDKVLVCSFARALYETLRAICCHK